MKKKYPSAILATIIIISAVISASAEERIHSKQQSSSIRKVLKKEKRTWVTKELSEIITTIDDRYNNLYNKLLKSKKIIIFFDPAHGKLPDGRWQGGSATKRLSCTNRPEEYYSIIFSRMMYNKLKNNPHIQVETTEDFMKVLKGKSNTYMNIPFSATVKKASNAGAFMIISEHLNNVSQIHKAGGKINIPGIHITRNSRGRKILKYVGGSYSGFLTLYNKLDASGFSKKYALNLKNDLTHRGINANNWEFGAVGDDRFSYFIDYPLSVIYESGFISNPREEKKLRDREYVKKITDGQYRALLLTIKEIFGIDISDDDIQKTGELKKSNIDLLKLSRITIYYLKNKDTKNALQTIDIMKKYYGKSYRSNIGYYINIRNKLKKAERYYRLGKKYSRKRWYKTAAKYYRRARNTTYDVRLLSAYTEKYSRYKGRKKIKKLRRIKRKDPLDANIKRAPLRRPVILAIDKGQTIDEAIMNALAPRRNNLKKLSKNFRNASISKWKKFRYYSKKRRKKITKWKKYSKKVNFKNGIYIVKLDRNFRVVKAKKVRSVLLNPAKYQNQQYLKNSYFCSGRKYKSL